MRISDWSSDVCASDLPLDTARCHRLLVTGAAGGLGTVLRHRLRPYADILRLSDISPMPPANQGAEVISCDLSDPPAVRSEERRVGHECVSTCRSRWSP